MDKVYPYLYKLFLVAFLVICVLEWCYAATAPQHKHQLQCKPFSYCQGTKFPSKFAIGDREIECNQNPAPSEQCCLPEAKHMVCYNLYVSLSDKGGQGYTMNFDDQNMPISTDFTQLCHAMLKSIGKKPDRYSSIVKGVGSGWLGYNNNMFKPAAPNQENGEHIVSIACSYKD